jgi:hypothetical protein
MDLFSRKGKDMLIYNFVSPIDGPTWSEYLFGHVYITKIYPIHNAIYFPLLFLFNHKIPYRICVWLCHFLPALLMDAVSICIGRSPRYVTNINVIFIIRYIHLIVYIQVR